MADPISAASLGLAIVAAFKDAYSTIQFIRRTIHTLRHFKSDKSELLTRYEVQVARLELFSLMLSGGRTNEPDASYLKTIPDVSYIIAPYSLSLSLSIFIRVRVREIIEIPSARPKDLRTAAKNIRRI